jgi:hypothetical protein
MQRKMPVTRDEAIQLAHCARVHPDFGTTLDIREAQKLVAGLVALGLLELDESNDEKLAKEFRNRLANPPPLANFLFFLRSALNDIGLKIVEK